MYRLNTYPVIHSGFFHAILNVLALTPLMERFEAEHGTLTAVALFVGRKLFWSRVDIRWLIVASSSVDVSWWDLYFG